jgi:hypothetical protein
MSGPATDVYAELPRPAADLLRADWRLCYGYPMTTTNTPLNFHQITDPVDSRFPAWAATEAGETGTIGAIIRMGDNESLTNAGYTWEVYMTGHAGGTITRSGHESSLGRAFGACDTEATAAVDDWVEAWLAAEGI